MEVLTGLPLNQTSNTRTSPELVQAWDEIKALKHQNAQQASQICDLKKEVAEYCDRLEGFGKGWMKLGLLCGVVPSSSYDSFDSSG